MDILIYKVNIKDKAISDIENYFKSFLTEKDLKKASEYKTNLGKKQSLVSSALKNKHIGSDIFFGKFGKPLSSDVYFNVSHSYDVIVLAKSSEVNVGVDVERIKDAKEKTLSRLFIACEKEFIAKDKVRNFYYIWTRKEAVAKCIGSGITLDLAQIDVMNNNDYKIETLFIDEYVISIAYENDGVERRINIIEERI